MWLEQCCVGKQGQNAVGHWYIRQKFYMDNNPNPIRGLVESGYPCTPTAAPVLRNTMIRSRYHFPSTLLSHSQVSSTLIPYTSKTHNCDPRGLRCVIRGLDRDVIPTPMCIAPQMTMASTWVLSIWDPDGKNVNPD